MARPNKDRVPKRHYFQIPTTQAMRDAVWDKSRELGITEFAMKVRLREQIEKVLETCAPIITLEPDVQAWVEQTAQRRGVTPSEVVSDIIRGFRRQYRV